MSDKSNGQPGKRSSAGERDSSPTPSTSSAPPPPPPSAILSSHSQDSDLFSFLSAMHLSGVPGTSAAAAASISADIITASRKRKFQEQAGSSSSGKVNGLRHAFMRRGSRDGEDEDATANAAVVQRSVSMPHDQHSLQTPQCSQSGYADEEDHQHLLAEAAAAAVAEATAAAGAAELAPSRRHPGLLSPVEIEEDENLAANFDDSLAGLGVDINTANYSMSEALLALPNLSISSSHIFNKDGRADAHLQQHSSSSPPPPPPPPSTAPPTAVYDAQRSFKDEPNSRSNSNSDIRHAVRQVNYGALDLSNDEAHLPDDVAHPGRSDDGAPKTFTGSVSRESSRGTTPQVAVAVAAKADDKEKSASPVASTATKTAKGGGGSGGGTTKETAAERRSTSGNRSSGHKVILPLQSMPPPAASTGPATTSGGGGGGEVKGKAKPVQVAKVERLNETTASEEPKFQYILVASTSIATKKDEASITYLNQGQSYELRLKKLGDLSGSRERRLMSRCRVCFHERRLQYMETEQIGEWRNSHPGERILDFDLPLSYGISDPQEDPKSTNSISFKWDPTRDTGVFLKVNCVSTEFTPKKHGGERGVPFRLQVETFEPSEGVRLHAAGCIMQVFKLKGADRKHKQDRDKIAKRPAAEQEKYTPSYDCTVLTDLNIDNIYVPPTSRSGTPQNESPGCGGGGGAGMLDESGGSCSSRGASPHRHAKSSTPTAVNTSPSTSLPTTIGGSVGATALARTASQPDLSMSSAAEAVVNWLSANRYGAHISCFRNYSGRDMLRLMRDEIVTLCGLADGIRLYNDLHMVAVAPRNTLYVAHKNQKEYHALFLQEPTAGELLARLAAVFGLEPRLFTRAFIVGPHGILIRVTDDVVMYTKPDTIFHFSLRPDEAADRCDVVLENVTHLLEAASAAVSEDALVMGGPPCPNGPNNGSR